VTEACWRCLALVLRVDGNGACLLLLECLSCMKMVCLATDGSGYIGVWSFISAACFTQIQLRCCEVVRC
jgi:hypothetical protein